ncbi:trypsin-like peptidase domain-containing protein [Neorhodopirellula pilleata]
MAQSGPLMADAILMEFSSEHCPPCRAMQPVVSELIARGVPVRQVDVAAEPQLTRRFQIRSTPTYVVVRDGQEVTRLLGTQSIEQLRDALQQSSSGPIVPTRSEFAPLNNRRPSEMPEPQTRLAPLAGGAAALTSAPTRSVRRELDQTFAQPASSQANSLPAMSGEPMPNAGLAGAVERAQAATVRLRVYDGRGYGAGTGTIIDVHGEEALVLTCGHLFRDGEGSDKIEVDVFVGGQPKTVAGHLVDFDAGDRDIGLVAIRPGISVQAVEVIRKDDVIRVGQTAFSFGCDRGDDPSRRDTRITGVDKYNQNIGASNLEISGAPIDGRSGGGLFDERGRLIGVCNAADYKSDIGIYTGPRSIQWQLDRVQLSHLYAPGAEGSVASVVNEVTEPTNDFGRSSARETDDVSLAGAFSDGGTIHEPTNDSATEMIVILRDRNGNTREQVLTLDRPDANLVEQIRQAAIRR